MPDNPNRLSQFWQELKRRKVVRVITVYSAAAFVILELVDIVTEPFGLPGWTMILVVVLLSVGFIISIIISWIYDIHPQGGIVKTELVNKEKPEDVPISSSSWKIASYISFIVIVGLILFHILSSNNRSREISNLETSIAVLPFENMSNDEEYSHIGGAFTDEIIMELQKIKAFDRVLSRTSTMQFEENRPTIPEIAAKINVNYLIDGSIQRHEDDVRIRIQFIRAIEEDHIWAEVYEGKWKDIFSIQAEIAFKVASELEMVLTPKEKQLIKKIPTTSLTAHDFYQRGKEEHWKYRSDNDNTEALERAEVLYHDALEYDSAFAKAYSGLARVYWDKYYWETYLSGNFLDSVLILADVALSFDDQLAEAYTVRGDYYSEIGFPEQAIREYEKAIRFNPNDWLAYSMSANLYDMSDDLVKTISYRHKAVSLNHGPEMSYLLRELWQDYNDAGFIEQSKFYNQEALNLDNDSAAYYYSLMYDEIVLGNFEKALEFGEKSYVLNSLSPEILLGLGEFYLQIGQYEESLKYYRKLINRLESLRRPYSGESGNIAYVFSANGFKDDAEYYFNEQINYCSRIIELDREFVHKFWEYFFLAQVYAFKGEKDKAYENLKIFNQRQKMCFWDAFVIKNDPHFNSIRDEPEFQQIAREIEAKYQAEHERVRQWLEENDIL